MTTLYRIRSRCLLNTKISTDLGSEKKVKRCKTWPLPFCCKHLAHTTHTDGTVFSHREPHYGHIRANIPARGQFFQPISQCLRCDLSEMHNDICVQIMGFRECWTHRKFLTKRRNRTAWSPANLGSNNRFTAKTSIIDTLYSLPHP
jgi:hypothetical protein